MGLETILPTDNQLTKKSEKNKKNRQNIKNSRYFDEISRLYLTRACVEIFEIISIKIDKISVNIDYFDLN